MRPPPRSCPSPPRSRPCARPSGPSPLHCLLSSPPAAAPAPKPSLTLPLLQAGSARAARPQGPASAAGRVGSVNRRRGGPHAGASVARQGQQGYDGCVGECEHLSDCGTPTGRPAPGPVISCSGFSCSCSFLPVICATACRGASLMQEPSGLLAPSLRVFPLFVIGGERRAAPQRPKGLWPRHARGASTTTPRPAR